ncbi:cadherin EGF LAG seven-pass G-type receptor 2-like [Petaurus breviceps papuanus]|uniref:cadherin EGF LAG seven-pass G-type receptor 2-like n=1 Tax=Petaurus breviceps papuanus TaxID=3040969 RepID=UPI0036DD4527
MMGGWENSSGALAHNNSTVGLPSCPLCPCSPGEHCEVNARSGRCAPGVCKNGGKCVNLLVGGFKCECPAGQYEKPYCGVTTRSFPAQSFVTFKGLRQRFHFTLSLTFATRERNALLLYNGRFNEKHDFLALEIIKEQIQLTFSAGETRTTVAPLVPGGVSDGQWHSVQVQYYNKVSASSIHSLMHFVLAIMKHQLCTLVGGGASVGRQEGVTDTPDLDHLQGVL